MTNEDLTEYGEILDSVGFALQRLDPKRILEIVLFAMEQESMLDVALDLVVDRVKHSTAKLNHDFRMYKEYMSYVGHIIPEIGNDMNPPEFLNIVRYWGLRDRLDVVHLKAIEYMGFHDRFDGWPDDIQKYVNKLIEMEK